VAKDKKKKKKKDGVSAAASLKALTKNPLVADVVASALVATAAAIKDSRKARRLAEEAGDELEKLAKEGADRGNAMWQLALEVGRRALDAYVGDSPKPKARTSPKPPKTPKPPKKTKRSKTGTRTH
jgi:hypothetical protein